MSNLDNQVVLITGANRGQGKSIAKHLASLGAKVAVGARVFKDAENLGHLWEFSFFLSFKLLRGQINTRKLIPIQKQGSI